jgi:hypothetical protein
VHKLTRSVEVDTPRLMETLNGKPTHDLCGPVPRNPIRALLARSEKKRERNQFRSLKVTIALLEDDTGGHLNAPFGVSS